MKKIMGFLLVCSVLFAGIAPVEFDWTNFVLKITTTDDIGITELLRKALMATQYDKTQTVADYLLSRPGVDEKITQLIHDYTNVHQNFLTDGGTEYVHQLSLTNKIMQELLPEKHPIHLLVPMLCPCCGHEWPPERPVPDTIDLIPQHTETSDYTGIIIDCRGYNLKPCLFPSIVAANGKEAYSVNFALSNYIVEWGLIKYTTDNDPRPARAGHKPLYVTAIGVTGTMQTDIVISLTDAQRIHGSKENVQLLKECRVVIIFG